MMNEKSVGKVKMMNAVKIAATVVGTLFLLAAVGEIAARMLFRKNVDALKFSQSDMYYYNDQQGVRHHIPNKIGYERLWDDSGKVEVRINSLGFRGKDIRADKAAKVTRIFFLGDSITFGSRLPENDIFVTKLGKRFQPDTGRTCEVVNGGAIDAGLREEQETLQRSIGIQPDLVVLCWYLNDGRPPLGFPEEVVFNNKIIQYINHQAWLRKSYLAGFIYDKVRAFLVSSRLSVMEGESRRFQWIGPYEKADWLTDERAFADLVRAARFDWGDAWDSNSMKNMTGKIGEIHEFLKQRRVPLCIVAFPSRVQVDTAVKADVVGKPQKELADYCAKSGIPFLDLVPALRKQNDQNLFFDNCHYTPHGNEVLTEELFKFIRQFV